ncbi:MAG: GTPase [Planctomycetota bacterium]|nr:GTPase [Planctomycetota bacterium]
MPLGDTIVALATGEGRSPAALIRCSGPHVREIVARLLTEPGGCAQRAEVQGETSGHRSLPGFTRKQGFLVDGVPGVPGVSRIPGVPEARCCVHATFALPAILPAWGTLRLPVVALRYLAPRSHTGEDALELLVPGEPSVIERVLLALTSIPNVRHAHPGEFSARAFLNGKVTLDEAEGVAAMIEAESSDDLHAAERIVQGRAGQEYRQWSDEVATLLALVEAGIDFTDQEDVVPIAPSALRTRLQSVCSAIRGVVGDERPRERRDQPPRVVLVGAPNAGKSTLFNALLGWKRAVTSPVAGTTRDALMEDVVFAAAHAEPALATLIDLPGIDQLAPEALASDGPFSDQGGSAGASAARDGLHGTPVEIQRAMQERAFEAAQDADVIVWCDASGAFQGQHVFVRGPGVAGAGSSASARAIIRVRTKVDRGWERLRRSSRGESDSGESHSNCIGVCALDGRGLQELRGAIARALGAGAGGTGSSGAGSNGPNSSGPNSSGPSFSGAGSSGAGSSDSRRRAGGVPRRHRAALALAAAHLDAACALVEVNAPALREPELVADALRAASHALGEITGRLSPDDILARVFSTFCIGK